MTDKVKNLIEQISNLKLMEAKELIDQLQVTFGVSLADINSRVIPTVKQEIVIPVVEKQTSFSVVLKNIGDTKINIIKLVREVTKLGLKEAKDFTESAPQTIKEGLSETEAEELKKKFTDAGATIEIV